MKVLICGAGRVTRELLKRLGESWSVTLLDMSEQRMKLLSPEFTNIQKTVAGDASSPVVLDQAGLAEQDYVLALTNSDEVNKATVGFAKEKGVPQILALVNDPVNLPEFAKLEVRLITAGIMMAKSIYHYLQDPRISVTPLTAGQGEILELQVGPHSWMVGNRAGMVSDANWRLTAIFRDEELLFPDAFTEIKPGDRLIVIGQHDTFKPLCNFLDCGGVHFPLSYGPGLLMVLTAGDRDKQGKILAESLHLAQNVRIRYMTVLCAEEECGIQEELQGWAETLDIRVHKTEGKLVDELKQLGTKQNYGLVVMPPLEKSFFKSLTKTVLVDLAHSLPCPVIFSRGTAPYKRILVPFNATPMAQTALETAMDLARQTQAEVTVVVVQEPEFLHTSKESAWVEEVFKKARDLAHIHKVNLEEVAKTGNPVREITALSKDYNLVVLGSNTKAKDLFSPHVGELLAEKSACSVLIVTS